MATPSVFCDPFGFANDHVSTNQMTLRWINSGSLRLLDLGARCRSNFRLMNVRWARSAHHGFERGQFWSIPDIRFSNCHLWTRV